MTPTIRDYVVMAPQLTHNIIDVTVNMDSGFPVHRPLLVTFSSVGQVKQLRLLGNYPPMEQSVKKAPDHELQRKKLKLSITKQMEDSEATLTSLWNAGDVTGMWKEWSIAVERGHNEALQPDKPQFKGRGTPKLTLSAPAQITIGGKWEGQVENLPQPTMTKTLQAMQKQRSRIENLLGILGPGCHGPINTGRSIKLRTIIQDAPQHPVQGIVSLSDPHQL